MAKVIPVTHPNSFFFKIYPKIAAPSPIPTLMIKNYLKIAWRNLLRNKSFSLINILGLSIGITTCLLIFLYVQYELGYDRYHTKKDRIVRISASFKTPDSDVPLAKSPILLAEELRRDYPEIESAVRLQDYNPIVKWGSKLFDEDDFYSTDSTIFSIFDFEFKEGSPQTCLQAPNSIVLTERMVKKYFGNQKAMGKGMVINNQNVTVTAVIVDPPANSDIKISALLAADFSKITDWLTQDPDVFTFALFKNKPDLKNFGDKLARLSSQKIQPELDKMDAKNYHVYFNLMPLAEVHYFKGLLDDTPKGNKQVSYIFSLLAVFILILAILNYINLSTARATERAKEVGIRKVNGARPVQLIRQFLFESFVLLSIAWTIAIVLVLLVMPLFNKILDTAITFSWWHLGVMVIIFLVSILLTGLYPAFVLSGFKPVEILKGKWRHSSSGVFFRKSLTVVQFVITGCLVTGAIVIYSQMKYISDKDLGFSMQKIITIGLDEDSVSQWAVPSFRHDVESIVGEGYVSAGSGIMGEGMAMSTTFAETESGGKRELMSIYQFVDKEFIPLLNIKIKEGRNITDSFRTDQNNAFIVNEAFVDKMGWKNALGKSMDGFNRKGKVVGVIKNYFFKSLHNAVEPIVILYNTRTVALVTVKTETKNISRIAEIWKAHFPSQPFQYDFLDEALAGQYKKDKTTQTLFTYFTFFAIFISAMGLYGLVSLMAVQRRKEISVRKVLGASLTQLISLLSKDFLNLILIASLLAIPISWYTMNKWLQDYAYHISLSWWMFTIPVVLIIFVALLVVAQQLFKAALENPVNSLRSE